MMNGGRINTFRTRIAALNARASQKRGDHNGGMSPLTKAKSPARSQQLGNLRHKPRLVLRQDVAVRAEADCQIELILKWHVERIAEDELQLRWSIDSRQILLCLFDHSATYVDTHQSLLHVRTKELHS